MKYLLGFFIFCLLTNPVEAHGKQPPKKLWKGLIREAVEDGDMGLLAVALCVRNRLSCNMNDGLVGLKKRDLDAFCKREGLRVERASKKIVKKVFTGQAKDITGGATYFEDVRHPTPSWAKGLKKTVQIKHHQFYATKD